MSDREFKPVPGYEKYYKVSNYGEVYSLRKNKIMKPKIDKDGYHEYALYSDGKTVFKRGHRLVAEVFVENKDPDNYDMVNHIDHSKDNNYYKNLEWCNNCLNIKHYYSGPNYGDGSLRTLSSLCKEDFRELVDLYLNKGYYYSDIVKHFNLSCRQDAIGEILSGRKLSFVSGITNDIRVGGRNPSYNYTDDTVRSVLHDHFIDNLPRRIIKDKYNVGDSWLSRTLSGKKRKDIYDEFMEAKNVRI